VLEAVARRRRLAPTSHDEEQLEDDSEHRKVSQDYDQS